jgi:hypothetical protein
MVLQIAIIAVCIIKSYLKTKYFLKDLDSLKKVIFKTRFSHATLKEIKNHKFDSKLCVLLDKKKNKN